MAWEDTADLKAIAEAQEKWREQDLQTFGKWDAESMDKRHNALLDLLCAHVPRPAGKGDRDG